MAGLPRYIAKVVGKLLMNDATAPAQRARRPRQGPYSEQELRAAVAERLEVRAGQRVDGDTTVWVPTGGPQQKLIRKQVKYHLHARCQAGLAVVGIGACCFAPLLGIGLYDCHVCQRRCRCHH